MRKLLTYSLLATALVFGGVLYADNEGGAGDDPNKKTTEKVADKEAEKVEYTPTEMMHEVNKLVKKMVQGLREVVKIQKVARKQQDVIKLNCVNDKLLQIKQLVNIADGAALEIVEAIEQNDESERYHQFGKIVIGEEQVRGLVEEAKNCMGEELIYIGPLDIDVDKPDVEGHEDPFPEVDLEPPAYASPFA